MDPVPETHFALSGGVHIAYQVLGEGSFDLVTIPPTAQNVEAAWGHPIVAKFLRRISSFCRFIHFDKRGTGMSDRVAMPTLDQRMDDARAVMDAVGSGSASLLGVSEGGPMAALFAAPYPERTSSLVLYGTAPRFTSAPDYPFQPDADSYASGTEIWAARWGTSETLTPAVFAPSLVGDADFMSWWPRYERQSASPGGVLELTRWNASIDIRPVLATIRVPTLILHRTDDLAISVANARYLAQTIPNATLVELPGQDHLPFAGDMDGLVDVIEEFLSGTRKAREPDRALATILFTDIVDSTRQAAKLGDRSWRKLLDRHDSLCHSQITQSRGRIVKTTGDGLLATFDGPGRAIRCAQSLIAASSALGLRLRAGLHTGEVELRGDDIGGIAVHTAARVAALADAGEILVSRTIADLVAGSDINFTDHGEHELKGIPGNWRLLRVSN